MNKLKEIIETNLGQGTKVFGEFVYVKNYTIEKSVELTTDVVIKFAEWCNKPSLEDLRQSNVIYIPSSDFYWYKHKKYTPKELFEEFINNHYGN